MEDTKRRVQTQEGWPPPVQADPCLEQLERLPPIRTVVRAQRSSWTDEPSRWGGAAAEFGSRVWRWRLEMNGAWILGLLSFDLAPGNRFWRAGIDLAGGAAKIWRGKVERRTAEHRIGRRKSNAGNRLGASASFSGGAIQPGV